MVLTERDRAIVVAVYQHRYLSTTQIEALLFPPDQGQAHSTKTSRCRLRLKLLYHHGFLGRLATGAQSPAAHSDLVYFLDRRGADLLRREQGTDVQWRPRHHGLSALFLEHTLRTNDVRIALTLATGRCGGKLLAWSDEVRLKMMNEKVPDLAHPGRTLPFRPDAFFGIEVGEKRARFFLEVDRGTMTTKCFQRKVRAYLSARQTGRTQEHFGTQNFRVLTVTTSHRRLTSLQHAVEKAGGDHHFWFSTLDKISPATVLHEAIWRVAGDATAHRLVE